MSQHPSVVVPIGSKSVRRRLAAIENTIWEMSMFFEYVAKEVGSITAKKTLEAVLTSLQPLITSQKALSYAKEELRARYELLIKPASYEHVVENMRLIKSDFLSYFLDDIPQESLHEHLHTLLVARSDTWIYNRPEPAVFRELIEDFLTAYERYFLVVDPHLSTLQTLEISGETLRIVSELRDLLLTNGEDQSSRTQSLSHDVKTFLTVLNVPFRIVEESTDRIDLIVLDPSSIFTNRFYLCAVERINDVSFFDELASRARLSGNMSNVFLTTREALSYEFTSYAERRAIDINSIADFRQKFLKVGPQERYVIGQIATRALTESLNIHEFYIQPDAVPTVPGDRMENLFYSTREPALNIVNSFLSGEGPDILFLFGGYGSGKSAFCAYVMSMLQSSQYEYTPVYFALRQLRSADDLLRVVIKADQLAKALESKTKSLIILDGLDEMPNAMAADEKKQNMLRLLQCAARTDKIVVTVRTAYFRGLEDFWRLFGRTHDNNLWNNMARFIPEGGKRPSVAAAILREFDTDQIETFINAYGATQGSASHFADIFLSEMKNADYGFNYMMLARNPLYLFLLVQSQPWRNPHAHCLADVLSIFIRYWLERDVEKGRSRWTLTTDDRLDFMHHLAWHMFQNFRHGLTFAEFDCIVAEYFGEAIKESDRWSLCIDLQTTGIFAATGNLIQFFVPAFLDYLIANLLCYSLNEPSRLPNLDQIYLVIGMIESRGIDLKLSCKTWMPRIGIVVEPTFGSQINISPMGIIYDEIKPGWNWPKINSEWRIDVRVLVNAVIQFAARTKRNQLPMCLVNRRGLHARAAAIFVKYCASLDTEVKVGKYGDEIIVDGRSIIGLMMLGAGPGTMLFLQYEEGAQENVESMLKKLGCERHDDLSGVWLLDFTEGGGSMPREDVERSVSSWAKAVSLISEV